MAHAYEVIEAATRLPLDKLSKDSEPNEQIVSEIRSEPEYLIEPS